ncbi:GNAT family N-acetyltransferase [Kitasatospora nipponensis]|uniref:GNAT family N-acetyltransferase n=1 Tax=Kitasatospora nipponensis TaxID=258049 RepID=A0ABN1WS39_9ACTN
MTSPPRVITLDGGLTLRCYQGDADLPEFHRAIDESLEHLRPWMPWIVEHSPAGTAGFLARRAELWASGAEFSFAIVLDGAIVGSCGLARRTNSPADGLEIGYWLHPAVTGRGLATRTARALVEEAFRLPGIGCVEIVHDVANHASGAVPARLGFTRALVRPAEPIAPAETGEEQVWRLTRQQAQALAAAETH